MVSINSNPEATYRPLFAVSRVQTKCWVWVKSGPAILASLGSLQAGPKQGPSRAQAGPKQGPSRAQARAQAGPKPGPSPGPSWAQARNLGPKKIQKIKILKIKIRSAQNVGKVWISRKKSSWPHLGPSGPIFCVGRKNPKNAKILPIFLGGPLLLSTQGGAIGKKLADPFQGLEGGK